MDEEKKKVDEAWKEHAEKEKQEGKGNPAGSDSEKGLPQDADFGFFVTSLAIQASIALGTTPNPINNQKEET